MIQTAQFAAQHFPPALDVDAALLPAEPLANTLAGVGGTDIAAVGVEPIQTRAAVGFAAHYFHSVAALQSSIQRHQLAVDFGADAAVAQFGVYLVGEIHRSRAGGKFYDAPFGGVDEYLVVENILLDRFNKLGSAGDIPLPFQ